MKTDGRKITFIYSNEIPQVNTMKKSKKQAREYHREKVNKWREDHKKKGLCRYCKNPAVKGMTRCKEHIEYSRIYRKAQEILKKRGKNVGDNRTPDNHR
jgi:hypothetical protein